MAIISVEYCNGIKYHVVDDMPDLSNDPTSRRWVEAAKDFMRKHPHPEIIEREDGSFDFVPYSRRISEKISSNNLATDK
jgi:hypothetical protein